MDESILLYEKAIKHGLDDLVMKYYLNKINKLKDAKKSKISIFPSKSAHSENILNLILSYKKSAMEYYLKGDYIQSNRLYENCVCNILDNLLHLHKKSVE